MATLNLKKKKFIDEDNLKQIIKIGINFGERLNSIETSLISEYDSTKTYIIGEACYHDNYIYKCKSTATGAWNPDRWQLIGDDITELTLDEIKAMLGLTTEQLTTLSSIILDSEVRLDKTYSSSKIYTDIQNAIDTAKAYTLSEIGKASGASYKIASSTSDMTDEKVIYLLDNNTNFDMYIVDNGTPTKIGNTNIDLSGYLKIDEANNDFLKKTDATSTYATKTELGDKADVTALDDKVNITDIIDNLTSTDTNKPLSANQGKVLKDEVDLKANDSEVVKKTSLVTSIDSTSTDDTIPSSKSVYDYIGTLNSLTGDIEYGNFKLIGNYTITSAIETTVKELIPFTGLLNSEGNMVSNNGLIALKKGKTYKITSAIRTNDVSSTDNGFIEFSLYDNKGNILKQGIANNGIIIRGNYPINYIITPNENISIGIYITYHTSPIKMIIGYDRSHLTITEIPNPTSIMNVTDNHIKEVANTYSANETVIGKWIDGKPLYRKVVDLGALPNTDTVRIPHNINDLDRIISMRGMAKSPTQNLLLPFPYGTGNDGVNSDGTVKVNSVPINIYEQQGNIVVYTLSDRTDMTGYVILEYTKTTD